MPARECGLVREGVRHMGEEGGRARHCSLVHGVGGVPSDHAGPALDHHVRAIEKRRGSRERSTSAESPMHCCWVLREAH